MTVQDGLLGQLAKAVLESALDAEMTEHLGHAKHADQPGREGANVRNGSRAKTAGCGVFEETRPWMAKFDARERQAESRPLPADIERTLQADNPHLAIEALRSLINEELARVARHNLARQRAFSERIGELMRRYANQQLTSAEVIAELIAMAKEVAAEADRGKQLYVAAGHR